MKKFLSILLAILMLVSILTACGAKEEAPEAPAAEEKVEEPKKEEPKEEEKKEEAPAEEAPVEEAPAGDEVLHVGVILPITGTNAESGAQQLAAIELATEHINANGGIGGKIRIELHVEDDQHTPATSVVVAQKLAYDTEVDVVIGPGKTTTSLAVMEITAEAGIPHIIPSSTGQNIVEQGNEWIVRTAVPDSITMNSVLDYCVAQGFKTFALAHDSADFGMNAKTVCDTLAPQKGLECVFDFTYNNNDTDYSTGLMSIAQSKPDVVILWANTVDGSKILAQRMQYGLADFPLIGYGWNYPDQLMELSGGDAIDGTLIATAFSMVGMEDKPELKKFVDDYNAYYGSNPSQNAANCYDSMLLLADAVERAGSVDRTAIRDALRSANFTGVNGTYAFDDRGEISKALTILRFDNQGNHYNID